MNSKNNDALPRLTGLGFKTVYVVRVTKNRLNHYALRTLLSRADNKGLEKIVSLQLRRVSLGRCEEPKKQLYK